MLKPVSSITPTEPHHASPTEASKAAVCAPRPALTRPHPRTCWESPEVVKDRVEKVGAVCLQGVPCGPVHAEGVLVRTREVRAVLHEDHHQRPGIAPCHCLQARQQVHREILQVLEPPTTSAREGS